MGAPRKGFRRHIHIDPYVYPGTSPRIDKFLEWYDSVPARQRTRMCFDLLVAATNGELGVAQAVSLQDEQEDVAQAAFVRVLTNLDRFDPRFRFSTWLFTIARRLFLNFREKRRPANGSETMGSWGSEAGRPEAGVSRAEMGVVARDALQRALMVLSLEQREVMILFHQQDWPIWLIAEHLEMPEGTVKSHLHRGRRRLREVLATTTQVAAEQTLEEAWL